MEGSGRGTRREVGSVARATALLDALAESESGLGVNELARRIGVNASTASRLLATLEAGHLVERVAGWPLPAGAEAGWARRPGAGPARRARARAAVADLAGGADRRVGDVVGARRRGGDHGRLRAGAVERRQHGAARSPEHLPRHRGRQGDARVRPADADPGGRAGGATPTARSPTTRRCAPSSPTSESRGSPRRSGEREADLAAMAAPVFGRGRRAGGDPRPAGARDAAAGVEAAGVAGPLTRAATEIGRALGSRAAAGLCFPP